MRSIYRVLFGGKKRKTMAGILTVTLAATTAWAAWNVIGNGSSKGGLGTLQAPTVEPGTTATYDLFPNSSAFTGSVAIKVTNPGTATLYIKASGAPDVGADNGWTVSGAANPAGCTVAILKTHLTAQARTGLSIPVNGSGTNGGVTEVVIPNVLKLADAAPTDCQGGTLNNLPAPSITFSTAP